MKSIQYNYFSQMQKEIIISIIQRQKIGWLSCGICGEVNGNKIQVYYRPGYRNSWNPVFLGSISEHESGTIINGSFETPLIVRTFIWAWRGFVGLMFLLSLTAFFSSTFPPLFLLIPGAMFAFSFVLVHFGETLGEKSKEEVIKFFKTELLVDVIN